MEPLMIDCEGGQWTLISEAQSIGWSCPAEFSQNDIDFYLGQLHSKQYCGHNPNKFVKSLSISFFDVRVPEMLSGCSGQVAGVG